MSRIGKTPIPVPPQVQVSVLGALVKAKGPLGELSMPLHPSVKAELKDKILHLTADYKTGRQVSALHGTMRARVANMVHGVNQGFTKVLDVVGLGFKAVVQGDKLMLNVGKSHSVEYIIPKGLKLTVDAKNIQITIMGPDKDLVGATAAGIRAVRPPEPYKGTGIRYQGEHIIRKAGKTAAGAGAGAGGGAKK